MKWGLNPSDIFNETAGHLLQKVLTTNASMEEKHQQWRSHQSVATICKNDGGYCRYDCCPGLARNNKRRRSYPTTYQCLQCSIAKGYPVYLCNTTKKGTDGAYYAVLCHVKYHEQQFGVAQADSDRRRGIDSEHRPMTESNRR